MANEAHGMPITAEHLHDELAMTLYTACDIYLFAVQN